VHTAFDQAGAVLGPLMVAYSVARSNQFGPAFWWLALPAAGAFLALLVARAFRPVESVKTPRRVTQTIPKVFWPYAAAAGLLALGFIDFPLLAYHFQKNSIAQPATIPLLYAGAMGLNGLTALVCGRLFDRFGIRVLSLATLVSLLTLP